jgi:DNA invertase Pin-like site-specific DNA recombinase
MGDNREAQISSDGWFVVPIHKSRILHKCVDTENKAELLCVSRFQKWRLTMTIYGYARVSTDGQSLASQDAQLKAANCAKVYAEKISGARSDRPELAKLLKRLSAGDVLIVTRLDRLARSTRDLLNILDTVAKGGAGFKSLSDPWADTTTPHGRLMLTILGGLAEFERSLILARTSDGRDRAKARGVQFGRPAKLTAHQQQEALERLAQGEAQADVARSFNVSQATISRLDGARSPFEDAGGGVHA